MTLIADLHIHSKYSRATSPLMEVEALAPWAKKKGIQVLGTGDFTHPAWNKLLKEELVEDASGLFKLKDGNYKARFILTTPQSLLRRLCGSRS